MWICTFLRHSNFFSSAFLRGLLPCVRTNNLAYVRHTSEGAWTVRDLGPIYSDLWDPFATVELCLLSVRCPRLLYFHLVSNVEHYILREPIFPFHARKFRSFVGSRTRVLSFRSLMFFHCASWPQLRHSILRDKIVYFTFKHNKNMKHSKNNLVKFKAKQQIKLSRGRICVANLIPPVNGVSLGSY